MDKTRPSEHFAGEDDFMPLGEDFADNLGNLAHDFDRDPNRDFELPIHRPTPATIDYGALRLGVATDPFESENQRRHECAKALEKYIQYSYEKFCLRGEHVAAIQLADMKQLEKGGRLWADPSNTVPSRMMKNRLSRISPFCRHYMLHLDPKNLTSPHWKHAVPEPVKKQPNPSDVPWDDGVKAYEKALSYHSRFQTRPDLQSIPLDEQQMEEAKCRERNEDKCAVTGRPKPRVFWIIPSTWNDTVDHMNATGDLCPGCLALTSINLLKDPTIPKGPDLSKGPDLPKESSPPVSVKKLGTTHKFWNMMLIDPVLYKYLKDGWCAFKYLFHKDDDNENVKVTLEFRWMPKLMPRFGQEMDIKNDWAEFSWQMDEFVNCPPPPGLEHGKVKDKSGDLLKSGYRFEVPIPKQHVAQFLSGIEVHWACIQFTALCGAAGRPWLLSGMDPEDESMQACQKKAISQDNQKMRGLRKTLSRAMMVKDTAVDAGKQVTDKLAGKLTGELTGKVSRPPLPDFKRPSSAPGASGASGAPDPPGPPRGPGGSE